MNKYKSFMVLNLVRLCEFPFGVTAHF
jgi:hypothetical protein